MNILVVDDEQTIAGILAESFNDEGLNATCLYSGQSAIDYLKEGNRPDLILSDIKMSPGTGIDIVDYIKNESLDIPIFLMTGYSEFTPKELITRGAAHVFQKPLDLDEIVNSVRTHLAA